MTHASDSPCHVCHVVRAESMKAETVKVLLKSHLPDVKYTNMHAAKARLARVLQEIFNTQPMMVNGAVVDHKFNAYPKLNPRCKEEWDAIFGSSSSEKQTAPSGAALPAYALALGHACCCCSARTAAACTPLAALSPRP